MVRLLVCDDFAEIGDVLFYFGDSFRPGASGGVRVGVASGVHSFGVGQMTEQDVETFL